jgi:hypothetical protein
VRTEDPFWLDAAYSRPTPDVGLVDRNLHFARAVVAVRRTLGGEGRVLDFGGGSGLLVRLVRDRGVDARWHDPMASNLFALGFESEPAADRWSLVSAIEVLEHAPRTKSVVAGLLASTDCLLVSTEAISEPPPAFSDWWYYLLGEGQHVSFPSRRGFGLLAEANHARLVSCGSTHLIVRATRRRVLALWVVLNALRVRAKLHSLRRTMLTRDASSLAEPNAHTNG